MNSNKLLVLLSVITVSFCTESFGKEYEITSPNKNIRLKIDVEQKIFYSLDYKSKQLIKPSAISMTLNGNRILGANPEVVDVHGGPKVLITRKRLRKSQPTIK